MAKPAGASEVDAIARRAIGSMFRQPYEHQTIELRFPQLDPSNLSMMAKSLLALQHCYNDLWIFCLWVRLSSHDTGRHGREWKLAQSGLWVLDAPSISVSQNRRLVDLFRHRKLDIRLPAVRHQSPSLGARWSRAPIEMSRCNQRNRTLDK